MIAVDSGGTKTNSVLFDETGHILHRAVTKGGNPLDIGVEASRKCFMEAAEHMTRLSPEPVSAIYAAMAGTYYFDKKELYPAEMLAPLGAERVHFEDDGICMISSELYDGQDAVGVICGTGSSAWVRKKELPEVVHLGGWGYLLDALGSGYSIGRNALRACCLAIDGRGPKTVLKELIEKNTGKEFVRGIPGLYDGGRPRIASLAYTVFEGAKMGDEVSCQLMEQGASEIAELIWTADRYFDKPYPVVIGGGIVTAFPEYGEMIRKKAPEHVTFILTEAPPVFGGATEAMHDCGLEVTEAFRRKFLEEYAVLSAKK